jgi:hypothetical protein
MNNMIDTNNIIDTDIIYICDKDKCTNNVNIFKSIPNLVGNRENQSKYMHITASGFRNRFSSFKKYLFCSENCLEHFKKYNCCYKCNENGEGNFIEELGYTLCYSRGDGEQSCIAKYLLELRLKDEYEKCGLYKLDTELKDTLLQNCDELKQIITDNGDMISYNMLMDIYNFHLFTEPREQKDTEQKDKKQFYELCNKIKNEVN